MPIREKRDRSAYSAAYRAKNREKIRAAQREDYRKNRAKRLAYSHEHIRRFPELYRARQLLRDYDMTIEQFQAIELTQGGKCAICFKPETAKNRAGVIKPLHVDHNHETQRVRGLICHRCNTMIGLALESPTILTSAIGYLRTRKGC